jgi:selenophosphate synthetase-related protein
MVGDFFMASHNFSLSEFINNINQFSNIDRKKILFPIMQQVRETGYNSPNVYKGMGEDAAAIFFNHPHNEDLVLITTDAINEEFSNNAPWSAGFCSILVELKISLHLEVILFAASVIISSSNEKIRNQLMQGILDASQKFQIPIVRGHTSDNTKNTGVSATVIGKMLKKDYILQETHKKEINWLWQSMGMVRLLIQINTIGIRLPIRILPKS